MQKQKLLYFAKHPRKKCHRVRGRIWIRPKTNLWFLNVDHIIFKNCCNYKRQRPISKPPLVVVVLFWIKWAVRELSKEMKLYVSGTDAQWCKKLDPLWWWRLLFKLNLKSTIWPSKHCWHSYRNMSLALSECRWMMKAVYIMNTWKYQV